MTDYHREVNSAALRTGAVIQNSFHVVKKKQKASAKKRRCILTCKTLLHGRFIREPKEQIQLIESMEFISEIVSVYSHVLFKGICRCIQHGKKLFAFALILRFVLPHLANNEIQTMACLHTSYSSIFPFGWSAIIIRLCCPSDMHLSI